jgi:Ecdysteroid kinase-like family
MTQHLGRASGVATAVGAEAVLTAGRRAFTPDQLTSVLHGAGVLTTDRRVVAVNARPLGVGESMMSELMRLELVYANSAAPGQPGSIVVKLSCPDEFRRRVADRFDFYRREIDFYQHLAGAVGMRSPRCYTSIIDEQSNEFTLLLEDLAAYRSISQADGCGLDDARLVARSLADFHATWWARTDELSTPVRSIGSSSQMDDLVETFTRSWPMCRQLAGDRIPQEVLAIGDRWATVGPDLARRLSTPCTLCHGDFRLDNLRFDGSGEVIAFDWQLLMLANGVTDLAYFVSQSMRTAERCGRDRQLLELYLARLAEQGVEYDSNDAWEVYRTAVLAMVIFPVTLYGGYDDLPPLGRRTTAAMLDRSVATITELEAWNVPAAQMLV